MAIPDLERSAMVEHFSRESQCVFDIVCLKTVSRGDLPVFQTKHSICGHRTSLTNARLASTDREAVDQVNCS